MDSCAAGPARHCLKGCAAGRFCRGRTGVGAQALCPGFTHTEFHDSPEYKNFDRNVVPKFLWMTADEVVQTSLRGLARNRCVVIPGFWNKLIVFMVGLPPVAALARAYGRRRWRKT